MPLPKQNTHTINDIYNLPDGQRAELGCINVYNFGTAIKAGIYDDLEICIADLLK